MKLAIERPHFDMLVAAFPDLELQRAQLRFGNKAEVPVAHLSDALCDLPRGPAVLDFLGHGHGPAHAALTQCAPIFSRQRSIAWSHSSR